MDCKSVSAAERVCDCGEGVQCPKERKPIFFMPGNLWTVELFCYRRFARVGIQQGKAFKEKCDA
jgi:hypothetical protein